MPTVRSSRGNVVIKVALYCEIRSHGDRKDSVAKILVNENGIYENLDSPENIKV